MALLTFLGTTSTLGTRAWAGSGISLSTSVFVTSESMQVIDQGQQIKFFGHVKATHARDILWSDELISDKTKQQLHAIGHVSLYKDNDSNVVWEGFGDEGTYDTLKNFIVLWTRDTRKKALLIRHPKDQPKTITLHLEANRLETDSDLSFAHAHGDSYGIDISTSSQQSLRFWAEDATYHQAQSSFLLQGGKPVLIIEQPSETRRVTGQTIEYLIDEEKLVTRGQAVAQIFPKGKRAP